MQAPKMLKPTKLFLAMSLAIYLNFYSQPSLKINKTIPYAPDNSLYGQFLFINY